MNRLVAASLVVISLTSRVHAQVRERVRSNDNRARAGIFSGAVLALRMEARLAEWHPDGEDRPGAVIPVFAEIGRQASIPGPLIRVPAGAEVITVVRNAVPNTVLTIHGLHSRPVLSAAFNDSVQLTYGQIQTLRFKLDRPGTYYYWGTTTGSSFGNRTHEDAQLTGAIVVDEAGERAPKDRIMVIGMWADTAMSETTRRRTRELFVINGRSWPQTDRLQYERGENVLWRVINASADVHPMHLHGYYFRVRRRGDGRADTTYGTRGELLNTERMAPGATAMLAWTADRLGNWLFHCHIPTHVAQRGPLGYPLQQSLAQAGEMNAGSMNMAMGGLVAAVEVKPAEEDTTSIATLTALPPAPPNARRIRMLLRPNTGSTPLTPLYGVAFDERGIEPPADVGQRAGPPLVLNRAEPVAITVLNHLTEPTSIHWHGIELESYFDGVADFAGAGRRIAPAIALRDSFEARFTPPRSGTFIYHPHADEVRQQQAGLSGALLVLDDPAAFDPSHDFVLLLTVPRLEADGETVWINGSSAPKPLELKVGERYRFRIVDIHTYRPSMIARLWRDSTLATWRAVAKDGMDLPPERATMRPALQQMGNGETYDFELVPTTPGDLRFAVNAAAGPLLASMLIRVR